VTGNTDDIRRKFAEAEDVAPAEGLQAPEQATPDPGHDAPPPLDPEDPGPGDEPPPEMAGALFPLNDSGNGNRFALYCGDDALHVARVGWHRWDDRRWKLDPDGIEVQRLAHRVQDHISRELPFVKPSRIEQELYAKEQSAEDLVRELNAVPAAGTGEDHAEKLSEAKAALSDLRKQTWGKGSTRARHLAFARAAGNTNTLKNMLHESRAFLTRDVEDLDADPLTVNTQSGILRFSVRGGPGQGFSKVADVQLEDHAREVNINGHNHPQYITKLMPAGYDPDAKRPGFDKFLERIQPDPEMRAFLQRWFGLSMTGEPVQKFLYMYGMGANGKSALASLMRRMLGEYATMVKIESLTGKNRKGGADATPDLMKLIGARAAITSEPEEGERMQEGKIKEMTGGESMLVRNLHSDFIEFTPYFKLTFTGNHKLEIRGTDDGIWRRPLLCPFDVQIPEGERDEKLVDRLWEERSGILNWMIEGLLSYLEAGLQEPDQVLSATSEYRKDSDPVGDYLTTCCVMTGESSDWLPASELISGCVLYQLENEGAAWTPGTISRRIKERQGKFMHPETLKTFTRHKRGVWGYLGVKLEDEFASRLKDAARDSKGQPTVRAADSTRSGDYPL